MVDGVMRENGWTKVEPGWWWAKLKTLQKEEIVKVEPPVQWSPAQFAYRAGSKSCYLVAEFDFINKVADL